MEFTGLPFEYETRYSDNYEEWGIPIERAALLEERDRQLEDYLAELNTAHPVIDVGDGAVPTGYTKGYWISGARVLLRVIGTLSIAGTTDTVANVLRDGSSIGTITIPAGDRIASASIGASFDADSFWQMQQTTAGTGAGGLTWFGEFS